MSRNLQHKSPSRAGKKTPTKRSQRFDYSSDDDYAGVDLITDSEEDEPDVEAAEEEAIIESEDDDDASAAPQPSVDDDHSSWAGFDNDEPFGEQPFFDEHMGRTENDSAYNASSEGGSRRPSKVHFEDSDSDTAHDSDNDDIFPDIFLPMDQLDRGFRRTLEKDNPDEDDGASSDDSYWDFQGSDGAAPPPEQTNLDGDIFDLGNLDNADKEGEKQADNEDDKDDSNSDSESSIGSASGYETDDGETTEEDLPPAARFVPARSVLRRDSSSSSSSEEDIPTIRRNTYRPQPQSRPTSLKNGPKLFSWKHDASKPFAVIDSKGKKLIMFRAKVARQFNLDNDFRIPAPTIGESDIDVGNLDQMSPMISNSANLMMSAMYSPNDALGNGQALGPPEAFYPFTSINANGTVTQEDQSSYDEEDLDDEDLWNIGDFLDFGDDSTDEEGDEQEIEGGSPSHAGTPSTNRSQRAATETASHPLLDHFDRGVVGAFRKNQTRHQLLSRNTASRESLAFSGPYRQGTLRGIKGGRLAAANTPITPMRKQKGTKQAISSSPGSPLAQNKRKFSVSSQPESSKRSRQ